MRILLVHNFYRSTAPSGEDAMFRMEADLLARKGQDVLTYTRQNDDIGAGLVDRLIAARDLFWSQRSYDELHELIARYKPQVAHFHNTYPLVSASGYRACKDLGVPVVQTLHNYRTICPGALLLRDGQPCERCVGRVPLPAVVHSCYRGSRAGSALLGSATVWNRIRGVFDHDVDRYFCLTAFARERFIRGGLPSTRLFIKPNTLVDPPSAGEHRGEYALFVGRLTPEKGAQTLIAAWRDAPLPLKVAGDGALRAELEASARASGAPVEFLGFRDKLEVQELMRDCRLLVIPSECYEGFPITVLEGLASGTPMLVSRIGALDELLEDRANCRKFVPGQPANLRAVLAEMLADHEALTRMSTDNRRLFEQRYEADRIIGQQLDHYQSLVL